MSNYYTQTVIREKIPEGDMTPIELLLLSNIFDSEYEDGLIYFFAEEQPQTSFTVDRLELQQAIATSPDKASVAHISATAQLAQGDPSCAMVDIDLSETPWETIFQDIVKRSKTLRYIRVNAAFTCDKMHADAFGGMATLITADKIFSKTTDELFTEFFAETGIAEPNSEEYGDQEPVVTSPE